MDKNRANDREYMKKEMEANRHCVRLLGEDLRKNPEFIIEMVKDKKFNYFWALLEVVDKSLINTDFIISYVKTLNERGAIKPSSIKKLCGILPSSFLDGNKKFWDAMIELGLTDHEICENSESGRLKRREKKIAEMMNRIDRVSIEEFVKLTNEVYRGKPEFMLEVISKNPSLYSCLSEELKLDADFIQLLKSKVPGIENIIEADEQKRQAIQSQKEKEKQERKFEDERQKEESKKQKELEEQNRIIQEYKEQGEQHPNLILVNDFLKTNTSKMLFCKKYNIDIEQLNNAIKEVSLVYPEIATKITERNKQTSAIYLNSIESIINKLLSGEMTIEQYSRENYKGKRIDAILDKITDENKRKQFHTLVVKAIASGKLTMMDYMRLFSKEYDYKTIINSINQYMKIASKEIPELQGKDKPLHMANIEIKSLKKYSRPYKSNDFIGTSKGYVDSKGKTIMVPIAEEYITYARKYLQLEDEYICYATMNSALSKLVKGEVTFEEIDEKTTKKISMKSVVANAINNGTTIEDVMHSDLIEQEHLQENIIEGETIDD